MGGELRSVVMKDERGGAEERKPEEKEQGGEGVGMQAGAGGGTGGACAITHQINQKVMPKYHYRIIFESKRCRFLQDDRRMNHLAHIQK